MKKFTCLLLTLILTISFTAFPKSVLAQDFEPFYAQNPFYAGEEVYTSINSVVSKTSKSKKLSGKTYYSDGKELYTSIKNKLCQRKKLVTVYYLSTSRLTTNSALRSLLSSFFVNSTEDEISTTCTDGDYLRWAISGYYLKNFSMNDFEAGNFYYQLDIEYYYYETPEQAAQVDKIINNFVKSVDMNILTDFEVMKKIHDFICNRTTYAYEEIENINKYSYIVTPYGTLVKGRSICQGYAVTFYRICKELGYNCRFVSSDPNIGCHAWNLVELDGKYYFVDTTWDDQIRDEPDNEQVKELYGSNSYYFFLVDYDTLRKNDTPYSYTHTLDEDYYDTSYFNERYESNFAKGDYDKEAPNLFSQCRISLSNTKYVYSGELNKPDITITDKNGNKLVKNTHYIVSYSKNKSVGLACVSIKGKGDYAESSSHRNFVISPQQMSAPCVEAGTRKSSSLTLKWSKCPSGASGYVIQKYSGGVWETVKTITSSSTLSYNVKSLCSGTKYQFRIAAYKEISKRKVYGGYSNVLTTMTLPEKTAFTSVSSSSKSISLKWRSVKCSGYQIQYSTNKSMKNAKTINAKSSAVRKRLTKLKKGKKYYVRIRPYVTHTGTKTGKKYTYYAKWSNKSNIICK